MVVQRTAEEPLPKTALVHHGFQVIDPCQDKGVSRTVVGPGERCLKASHVQTREHEPDSTDNECRGVMYDEGGAENDGFAPFVAGCVEIVEHCSQCVVVMPFVFLHITRFVGM